MGTRSLLATIDLMGGDTFTRKELAESARELFVKTVVAVCCHDLDIQDPHLVLSGLARCTTLPEFDEEPRDTVYNAYVQAMMAGLEGYDEERAGECFGDDIDWGRVQAPRSWLIRAARAYAQYDVLDTKQWYAECRRQSEAEKGGDQ